MTISLGDFVEIMEIILLLFARKMFKH